MATKNTEVKENKDLEANISIEQICAAIISTYGTAVVPIDNLLKDYSDKNIAVNQDLETKELTFSLVDSSEKVSEEDQAETE
jgi:hypothetical protein